MKLAVGVVAVGVLGCLGCGVDGGSDEVRADTQGGLDSVGATDGDDSEATVAPTCEGIGSTTLRLTQDGIDLRDADGRAVKLRGVNAGSRAKFTPYVPFAYRDIDANAPLFDEALAAYYDRIVGWGLNVVRMPFTWEAIEPARGTYDEAFLTRLDAMIAAASERHIRVVLDFHQDVFGHRYCGDGFPEWALGDPAVARPADCSTWFLNYFQNTDMMADFDRFWANDDGLRDAFEALWTMLAERYADTDAVIGFEVMNEPGWGTHDLAEFSRDVLTPFYTRMVEVIRAVAKDTLIFVDPTGLDGVSGDTALERPVGDGIVFAPHYYNPLAISGTGVPEAAIVDEVLAKWQAVGRAWNVPVLIGEFGLPAATPDANQFLRANWDAFDRLGLHGTQWEYSVTGDKWNAESMSLVDSDGSERAIALELVRAYPVAVSGELARWSFERTTSIAEIAFVVANPSDSPARPTLVAVPAALYGSRAPHVEVDGDACTRWDAERQLLVIGGSGAVRVRISPEP